MIGFLVSSMQPHVHQAGCLQDICSLTVSAAKATSLVLAAGNTSQGLNKKAWHTFMRASHGASLQCRDVCSCEAQMLPSKSAGEPENATLC